MVIDKLRQQSKMVFYIIVNFFLWLIKAKAMKRRFPNIQKVFVLQ